MTNNEELKLRIIDNAALIDRALDGYVERLMKRSAVNYPKLREAMRYSLLSGGKRVRPFLTIEFCRALGGSAADAMPFACAVEMIHTYSLIHDDLPCMDNDDLRRGKPTSHVVFGYSGALLAGDALQAMAFETAAGCGLGAEQTVEAVRLIAESAGGSGMCGGQQLDLESENRKLTFDELELTQSLKTGMLIKCACRLGVIAAGKMNTHFEAAADAYADGIGRAFQIIDDLLDTARDTAASGKSDGGNEGDAKTTFMTYMTENEARAYAAALTDRAVKAAASMENGQILANFAEYLLNRKN